MPLTVPTIKSPADPSFSSLQLIPTWFEDESKAMSVYTVLLDTKTTGVPKLIEVPLTVPTTAVP